MRCSRITQNSTNTRVLFCAILVIILEWITSAIGLEVLSVTILALIAVTVAMRLFITMANIMAFRIFVNDRMNITLKRVMG